MSFDQDVERKQQNLRTDEQPPKTSMTNLVKSGREFQELVKNLQSDFGRMSICCCRGQGDMARTV